MQPGETAPSRKRVNYVMHETDMWNRASFLTRLVASSVRISEAAGATIKNVMTGGDLKIVDKSIEGEPADLQTEADRRAQYLIVKSLTERFGNINIIGEEDVTSECNGVEKSFAVDVLRVEDELGSELKSVKPEDVVVWVDPLDGTAEVALAIKNNNSTQPQRVVVTTRSHLSQSVTDALNALKEKGLVDVIEKYGGAGYKVLKVLEGSAAYVFASSGCKKWDTCAVEAVLNAAERLSLLYAKVASCVVHYVVMNAADVSLEQTEKVHI
ncbi:inositol monophosphatase family protein [Cooperia oncophora]